MYELPALYGKIVPVLTSSVRRKDVMNQDEALKSSPKYYFSQIVGHGFTEFRKGQAQYILWIAAH